MKTKNIFIIFGVLLIALGVWIASSWMTERPQKQESPTITATSTQEDVYNGVATTTEETITETASSTADIMPKEEIPAPRIAVSESLFNYDIVLGKTPCNDKIGSFDVTSSDPSQTLYWGMTGAMPIWLTFSSVEGVTPATVDMHFNCIVSGAEDTIDWKFVIVEKTADGKYVDGYYRSVSLKGDITKE